MWQTILVKWMRRRKRVILVAEYDGLVNTFWGRRRSTTPSVPTVPEFN